MGRTTVYYPPRRDPVDHASKQAVAQRQAQTSAYAAARFNEWAQGAQEREQIQQLKIQNLQSEAQLKGAQLQYGMWKDNELRRQTTAYYTAMPRLQEGLKQAGIYPGSERYAAEMAAFAAELPDAITHNQAIREDLKNFSKVDDTAAHISSKVKTLRQAFSEVGQKPTSFSTTSEGNIDVKATRPIDEGLKRMGLSSTEFLNHVNAKQGKFDDQGNFTQQLAPGEEANAISFQAGYDQNHPNKLRPNVLPLSRFNELRQELGVDPIPAFVNQQGAPTPSPTPNQVGTATASPTPGLRFNPATGEYE